MLDDPIQEFIKLLRSNSGQKALLQKTFGRVVMKVAQEVDDLKRGVEKARENITSFFRDIAIDSSFKIEVRSSDIESAKNTSRPRLIRGKVIFNKLIGGLWKSEVDCFVASGSWHKLGELREHKIDIVEHLSKLLPPQQGWQNRDSKRSIGLVTFQNGINNTLDDFQEMGQQIVDQFPEGPLCIGLHNQTFCSDLEENPTMQLVLGPGSSFLVKNCRPLIDMLRFLNESELNSSSVYSLCQLMKTFGDALSQLNPDLIWVHIAHSEGALIANTVFELCGQKKWLTNASCCMKKQLITATYGAVTPIRDGYAFGARNTYSPQDIVLLLSQSHFDLDFTKLNKGEYTSVKDREGKEHTIRMVDSMLNKDGLFTEELFMKMLTASEQTSTALEEQFPGLFAGQRIFRAAYYTASCASTSVNDHGFTEDTYKNALKYDIGNLRETYRVYDPKTIH